MKILLFGKNGQVGFELQRSLASLGEVIALDRSTLDLNDLIQLETTIKNIAPDVIVNAAAYTQVDKAQNDVTIAKRINVQVPEVMAKAAHEIGAWFIHYSTDYVFDGSKTSPYVETDIMNPLNVYGQTKAWGEAAIRDTSCKHIILRTSWVYAAHGKNFLRTILKLAQTREQLSIVDDQIGAPTSAELIADMTALLLYRLKWDSSLKDFHADTFHLTASGQTSWYGFASFLLNEAEKNHMVLKASVEKMLAITTKDYPTPAQRPLNSKLDTQKISKQFGIELPKWQYHVARTVGMIAEGAKE